ncbi:hypothetical protein AB7849_11540 [Rhodanobacter sp. 115]|uniref:hypothetical protein n=1 Tax=Rhodanobacter sp. FW021-MT20 TaxID=1162282 RepID=UPI000260D251|nr:hypothetical protein [Rhodanobacter sp. 115]EIL98227.1 hypothetical protein UU5_03947 [Rhodanobacter sp. 115]
MKNEANGLTISATFGHVPCIENYLFEVRAGVAVDQATSTAACLAEAIQRIACNSVDGGMDGEVAYLVAFAADAISALASSADGAYRSKEEQP